jgi:hypothetical protein
MFEFLRKLFKKEIKEEIKEKPKIEQQIYYTPKMAKRKRINRRRNYLAKISRKRNRGQ